MMHHEVKHVNEVMINGESIKYDFCYEGDKHKGETWHRKNFKRGTLIYLGKSNITYHNGTKNTWPREKHFWSFTKL